MNRRFVITESQIHQKDFTVFAEYDADNRLMTVSCEEQGTQSILGNIYIARVRDVVENLNAAFLDIGAGITCYYSLEDLKNPIFTHRTSTKKSLCQGDEIVVQVMKDAVKTKFPVVTTNLSFTGNYVVLTTANHKLGVSGKLSDEVRKTYKEQFSSCDLSEYGLIVRTAAKDASMEEVLAEYEALREELMHLRSTCIHKTCYQCLRQSEPFYVQELRKRSIDKTEDTDEIITDMAEIGKILQQYGFPVRFYQDTSYPLDRLYPVESGIADALKERVWLKSGANLIISPTEAMTVIDVNSGKNTAAKTKRENILRINIEAAKEIARQLRLRNISGICIIDFINMKAKEDTSRLMQEFRSFLKSDPVSVQLVDITRLGLVEVTRKKEKRSLYEQIYGSQSYKK